MRLKLTVPASCRAALGEVLAQRAAVVETETAAGAGDSAGAGGEAYVLTMQVDPGVFRDLHAFLQSETDNQGRIEVLSFAVTVEGSETGGEYAVASAAAAAASAAARPVHGDEDGGAPAAASSSGGGGGGGAAAAAPARQPRLASAASAAAAAAARRGAADGEAATGASGRVVYEKGPVAALPEAFASRRERFIELDALQPGWLVELRERGESVDAVFYAPGGDKVGPFASARRAALQWKQKQG
jgi:hypothetical protein